MGLLNISRVCAAVFLAAAISPALAATDKPNYFYNAATKTWIPSRDAVITPQGTIINNSAAAQAQRYLDGQGGFVNKSTVHANFPAVKKTVPITIDAKTPPSRTKLAAKNLLKGGIAGIVLSEGLNQLFNGLDWVMGEGGTIRKIGTPVYSELGSCVGCGERSSRRRSNASYANCAQPIVSGEICVIGNATGANYCARTANDNPLVGYRPGAANTATCYYSSTIPAPEPHLAPLSPQDIDDGVDSSYVPHVSDYEWLAPYMDPTAIEITDLPRLMSPPVTKTIYDADGNPVQVSETNIWHDFDIRNNDSTQPEIDVKTTEETKVYEGGTLVSTNTTTSTSSADPDAAPSADGGGDFEIPTDCDFMPTVCAFIDWFKDDDLGDEPDLKSIMKDDEDFAKTKTISFGAAVCPAPHTIQIPSLGMSVDLSFEFFCQFAEYARALVLAAAYIFAAYISLGVARG